MWNLRRTCAHLVPRVRVSTLRDNGGHVATVDRWSGLHARHLRQALRLTVRDFAENLGVSPRTISKWESARLAVVPRPELQAALDTVLARATEEQRERFATGVRVADISVRDWADVRSQAFAMDADERMARLLRASPGLPRLTIEQVHLLIRLLDDAADLAEDELVSYFDRQLVAWCVLQAVPGQQV